eukprot:TRINITY_DN3382_c0_g1_i2.p2 TRINITY_DN3382_c0_g1~~TRINITY_DN3382_c0_g1_i2.p2  ORF type:complete len:140 (+),score=14.33 TRINITY_DN3382_c0_g1_i2:107-526(+)
MSFSSGQRRRGQGQRKHRPGLSSSPFTFDSLPQEVLINIAKKFDNAKDLASFGVISKNCQSVCEDHTVWQHLTMTKFSGMISYFGQDKELEQSDLSKDIWKKLYRDNHNILYNIFFRQQSQFFRLESLNLPVQLDYPIA